MDVISQFDKDHHYDLVVIGSGIGGLTAATLASKILKKKVLVLEQHFKPGGLTHTFRRKGYEWCAGLHYVGEMQHGGFARNLMNFVSDNKVSWVKMPEAFEVYEFPNFTFKQKSKKEFIRDLYKKFPNEKSQIDRYFKDMRRVLNWGILRMGGQIFPYLLGLLPKLLSKIFARHSKMTLQEYFDSTELSPELKNVLTAQFGDHGLAPEDASFFIHALISNHYKNGGFYPAEGPMKISESAVESLKQRGSEVFLKSTVTKIHTKNKKITGVTAVRNNKEFQIKCSKVISTVGLKNTFSNLISDPAMENLKAELDKYSPNATFVTMYIGFKTSPKKFGFTGANHWIFKTNDLNSIKHSHENIIKNGIKIAYLSFPSLKKATINEKHTATMIIPVDPETFSRWEGSQWQKRSEGYTEYKEQLHQLMIQFLENNYPGLTKEIAFSELSTPLSTEYFTKYHKGQSYGLSATVERFHSQSFGPRTKIKGLYLGGADVLAHGVVGAMSGGLVAITAMLGPLDVIKVFKHINRTQNNFNEPK